MTGPVFEARGLSRANRAWCPDCGGVTGIRVCNACHIPLPATFVGSRNPLICLAGPKAVGKTVYLAVLLHSLLNVIRRRFGVDVTITSSRDRFGAPRTELASLFEYGRLPPATQKAEGGVREPLVVEWRGAVRGWWRRRYRGSVLSFYDTAGEDLSSLGNTTELRYLGAASGLILFIDPLAFPRLRDMLIQPPELSTLESPIDVLARLTDVMRTSHGVGTAKRIRVPVAVALTKIDALFELLGADHPLLHQPAQGPYYDETAGRGTHEQIRALLRDWDADAIDAHLSHHYANFRYFVVSSLGWPPNYETGVLSPHGVAPFRIEEPLTWLLSRFGVVSSRGE
jgi:hypothetical protein